MHLSTLVEALRILLKFLIVESLLIEKFRLVFEHFPSAISEHLLSVIGM
ncbi:hypothetical protein VIRA109638_13145 [Vibrio rarus]